MPGLFLEVTVFIDPTNLPKFLSAFRACFDHVTQEPECTFFELLTSPTDPGMVHWVEGWSKDQKWLMETQLQKEYYKPYFVATEPLFVKPREFQVYERVEGWAHAKQGHFEGKYVELK